jgi:ATP-dependent DNA helicase RecG
VHTYFQKNIEFVKSVGPQKAAILRKELGIETVEDLIYHFPYRYADRSKFYTIAALNADLPYVQLKGIVTNIKAFGNKRTTRLQAVFKDETGSMDLVWFQGITWIRDSVKAGSPYVIFGKPTLFNSTWNMVHPEMEELEKFMAQPYKGFQPFYFTTEKSKKHALDSKGLLRTVKQALLAMPNDIPETLPQDIRQTFNLMPLREALVQVHFPENETLLRQSRFRLKFEELFYIQLRLLLNKNQRNATHCGKVFKEVGYLFNTFYKEHLPFKLTNAQKNVLKDIRKDTATGQQMNRLLQGDVGSGKTVVALLTMLLSLDNGFQACMMAPTEILANQHFESLKTLLGRLPIEIDLLTGSTPESKKKSILQRLNDGTTHLLVGTHALIESRVKFANLGMVIIDEQHRFGVEQRAKLWMKEQPPHVLVMTATPIPRTLAMTLYGDLDVSVINELPAGRKPIKTMHLFESSRLRVIGFMKEQIKAGRQIYVVYPLIEESEKLDLMNLMDGYDALRRDFPLPEYTISIVHGKMSAKDKDYEMEQFVKGRTQIMIATTVIEVGVNVPNATVMVVESAERFGLSQLHQLRGRVGRGAEQSYCILMTGSKLSAVARERMKTMVRTNDGFEIAETDLKLRGPGDITGTQQSGLLNLKIAEIAKDGAILELARKSVLLLLQNDPHLQQPEHKICLNQLMKNRKEQMNWSKVS